MTKFRYLAASLRHYWLTNLAVFCGVVAATAVIGGALIVGDSVRESLTRMSLDRLGRVDHALVGQQFFREDLANEINQSQNPVRVAPAIVLQGSVSATIEDDDGSTRTLRAGGVNVYGVEDFFWDLIAHGTPAPTGTEVILNRRAAEQLPGAEDISLVIEIPAAIPRDALLGDRDETMVALDLTIVSVAPDESTLGRFGLNPSQQLPANAYVPLSTLQRQLGLQATTPTPRNPIAQIGRVNALFGTSIQPGAPIADLPEIAMEESATLAEAVAKSQSLDDLSLDLEINDEHGYFALESARMVLDHATADAAQGVAREMGLETSPVLVYLVNEIVNPDDPDAYSMYPVAAGFDVIDAAPFGPFPYVTPPEGPLGPRDIVINSWLAEDLHVDVGDSVDVKYHVVGDRGELPEVEETFRVAGIVDLSGAADDRGFTPNVPGITDVEGFDDWRQPFPIDIDRVTPRDDEYWDEYRATPKIFLSLEAAQDLWRSRYGDLTSIRIAPGEGQSPTDTAEEFRGRLLEALGPEETGLAFQPVKLLGVSAARGTTDFAGLFIGFSFFLILAATILIGLLFRLGIERRMSQIGLLAAVGLPERMVRRLFLLEGALVSMTGGLVGLWAAAGYAGLMIYGLKHWWFDAIGTRFLNLHVTGQSLAIGFVIAELVAVGAIWWGIRATRGFSVRELLAGKTQSQVAQVTAGRRVRRAAQVSGGLAAILLAAGLFGFVPASEAFGGFSWRTVSFFVVGVSALVASLCGLSVLLSADRGEVGGWGLTAVTILAWRNAARRRGRSVMTASLIASASFVIVAVAAGHRNPAVETPDVRSGNGGFLLVATASAPLLYDLNTADGRTELGFTDLTPDQQQLADSIHVAALRRHLGEDASCLNLYRTRLPTILGVPSDVLAEFTESRRFKFADTPSSTPWKLLEEERPSGRIPVIGDLNTLQYSLKKGIGDAIEVPDSETELEVAGMLDASVLQGVLLMSEQYFHDLFPDQEGYEYFLIEAPIADEVRVSELLETELADFGFDAEPISDVLADLLSVQNTYLSTFQTLGGLGLLVGTIGLATVMLRNVFERRSEIALLRAVGFRHGGVALLVLLETGYLLLWGVASGTISALLAMAPHLGTIGADLPWLPLITMLGAVVVIGMLSAWAAVIDAVSTPIVAGLRTD